MTSRFFRAGVLSLWLVYLTSGCGPAQIPRGAVQGKVTLDGQPFPDGRITFEPIAGTKGPTAGGEIRNGEYNIESRNGPVPGKNVIRINATKKSGKKVPSPFGGDKVDEFVEVVGSSYNVNSILEREIQAGANSLNFDVKSR